MEKITQEVLLFYGYDAQEVLNKPKNTRHEALAKQMASYLIKEFVPESSSRKIGRYFNRHFTTIILGWKIIRDELQVSKERVSEYELLKENILLNG